MEEKNLIDSLKLLYRNFYIEKCTVPLSTHDILKGQEEVIYSYHHLTSQHGIKITDY